MILAFDTSAAHVAAALLSEGQIVASHFEERAKGQDAELFGVLDQVLAGGSASWPDLGAVGVGVGPGNFTGVRIAVAAAKGLALSLNIPARGVNGFEQALFDAPPGAVGVIGAPRGQAYVSGTDGGRLVGADDIPDAVKHAACLVGPGAQAVADRTGHDVHPTNQNPAIAIAHVAALARNETPKPFYLKAPDAAPSRMAAPKIIA